jgi:hypothetical protein
MIVVPSELSKERRKEKEIKVQPSYDYAATVQSFQKAFLQFLWK